MRVIKYARLGKMCCLNVRKNHLELYLKYVDREYAITKTQYRVI